MSNRTSVYQLPLFDTIQIKLTRNYTALVSPEDADLAQYKWYSSVISDTCVYAMRDDYSSGSRNNIALHRLILSRMLGRPLLQGEVCDHIDLNTLDNRRRNLRLATCSDNQRNKPMYKNNKSGFKGVYQSGNSWKASITVKGKTIHLGSYSTPEQAHEVYCEAARKYHGEFARLK